MTSETENQNVTKTQELTELPSTGIVELDEHIDQLDVDSQVAAFVMMEIMSGYKDLGLKIHNRLWAQLEAIKGRKTADYELSLDNHPEDNTTFWLAFWTGLGLFDHLN